MKYRRMANVAVLVFAACAVALGFVTAWFQLTERQAMVVAGLYLVGGLPGVLYLHFIARADGNPDRE